MENRTKHLILSIASPFLISVDAFFLSIVLAIVLSLLGIGFLAYLG